MANKVIKLSDSSSKDNQSLLVYADLSIDSTPSPLQLRQLYYDDVDATGPVNRFLQQDISGDDNQKYILQEVNKGHLKLSTKTDHQNLWNSTYNAQQRSKANYKLEKNVNLIAIKQAIKNIFTWTPGERILNPEFGSKLRSYLYEGITPYNQEQIMAEIRHCFSEWEPRAKLDKVVNLTDVQDRESNTVRMEIIYSVPSLNISQQSYVYEVQETV